MASTTRASLRPARWYPSSQADTSSSAVDRPRAATATSRPSVVPGAESLAPSGPPVRGCHTEGVAQRQGRTPAHGRGARTARLGRVAAGGAARWAGDRLDARGTEEAQRRRRGERVVRTVDALVDQLAV